MLRIRRIISIRFASDQSFTLSQLQCPLRTKTITSVKDHLIVCIEILDAVQVRVPIMIIVPHTNLLRVDAFINTLIVPAHRHGQHRL